ncbi:MAG TPA: protease inhibitor I42 family protein [Candidatus Tumulicola sp.]|jgi:hypothetical protein
MENDRSVTLFAGESMQFRLQSRTSAGYQWFARNERDSVVRVELAYDTSMVGSAAMSPDTVVTLTGLTPGRAEIVLEQKRAFETTIRRTVRTYVAVESAPASHAKEP